jgi:Ni2+-binding GTPase involved in maturation of urease and hydrogenase
MGTLNDAYPMQWSEARLPVTIVTGFLGSGKTTLLNHILANQHGLKIALMVNEIGEIGIDSELIVSAGDDMLELSNGCICCSVNNDLVDGIFRVLERDQKIDYLIVERRSFTDNSDIPPFGVSRSDPRRFGNCNRGCR